MIQWARFASKATKLGKKKTFDRLKAKMKSGKLKTGYDQILSSGSAFGSQFKAANAAAIKKSKKATDLYFKNRKKQRIASAVDLGIGATGGYLIGTSFNKKDDV
tara:strand:+ start:245 stop:556 length:312 start_codon:yes stop_codon:yes gene_type:complete